MNKTGFGFLRLPRVNPADDKIIDYELLNAMVDSFLAQGGDYFDTAYTYLGGLSEEDWFFLSRQPGTAGPDFECSPGSGLCPVAD